MGVHLTGSSSDVVGVGSLKIKKIILYPIDDMNVSQRTKLTLSSMLWSVQVIEEHNKLPQSNIYQIVMFELFCYLLLLLQQLNSSNLLVK